ncbi:hypothetical protein F8388_005451 [Cannabis sativa]|uniref:Uncharacterized protein n=1 Tax=Cannabis sativa TaxID=3483 RepID=A0A7J6EHE0_CANSA|nr:hypothetical protein F8388_005451 [Cannabis sativa]KAF4357863.1 hypothetical protein G4B88_003597 [Cannabis sativa]
MSGPTTLPPTTCPCPPARLTERDVVDGSASAQNTNPSLAAASEVSHALGYVGAAGYLHDVASEGVWAVSCYEYGWFWLVFGSGRSAPGPSVAHFDCSFSWLVAVLSFVVFVVVSATCGVAH